MIRQGDPQGVIGEAVVVDPVLGLVDAVGNVRRWPLGPAVPSSPALALAAPQHALAAEALDQFQQARLAGSVGRDLGVDVAHDEIGRAHVGADHLFQDAGPEIGRQVEAQQRDTQSLGEDVPGRGVRPGRAATDVDMVADAGTEGDQFVPAKIGVKRTKSLRCCPPLYGSLVSSASPGRNERTS